MHFDAKFNATDQSFTASFGEVHNVSDGGFERGYDAGYEKGNTDGQEVGYTKGHAEGEKAEYDRFWENVLNPPSKYMSWGYRFAGQAWNEVTFNPPCDIVPVDSIGGFFMGSAISDLEALLNKCGKVIDYSKVTSFSQMFSDSQITRVGTIDTRNASHVKYILYNATSMVTVEKIILKQDGSQAFDSGFINARKLQNITFEGTIGKSISFADSPLLTDVSVQSIIDHLKDLTGQTAQTLTFHADVGGKLTAEQKAAITAKNWTLVY